MLFYVLFVCKCVLPPGDNPIAVNKYITYQKRNRLQEENTRKKAQKMEEMRQKSLKGTPKRSENQSEMERKQADVEQDAGSGEDDNDAEWYRKEVGHDPETGLFDSLPQRKNKRKLSSSGSFNKRKKAESLKYGTNTEMNSATQNKFFKGKQKFARHGADQKNEFHKKKVFSSEMFIYDMCKSVNTAFYSTSLLLAFPREFEC